MKRRRATFRRRIFSTTKGGPLPNSPLWWESQQEGWRNWYTHRTSTAATKGDPKSASSHAGAAVTEGLLLYDYFEPISTFFLTLDERVWLADAAASEGHEAVWVVLGPEGEPEFRVRAPTGIAFEAALGGRVWGTGRTELDVPYIVLYELRSPGSCG